jgi:hypothetical protein
MSPDPLPVDPLPLRNLPMVMVESMGLVTWK